MVDTRCLDDSPFSEILHTLILKWSANVLVGIESSMVTCGEMKSLIYGTKIPNADNIR